MSHFTGLKGDYADVPCSINCHTIEAMEKIPDCIIGSSNVGPQSRQIS